MQTVTDFLDEKRKEISERLKELKPLVEEHSRLEAAASALQGVGGSAAAKITTRRRGPGRPRGSSTRKVATATTTRKAAGRKAARATGKRRAGRRKGSGT